MSKGKFIVLEGVEGVGKSKQAGFLKENLARRGIQAIVTREPGGAPLGEKLRELILDPQYNEDAITELFMYSASRRAHLNEIVLPALNSGKIVICDRFIYSTVAYQGYGRGLDVDFIRSVNAKTIEPTEVDLALFLDLSPRDGFKRKGGADGGDRLERENIEFFDRVYKGFCDMADGGELVRIDASGAKEHTATLIMNEVDKIL